MSNKYDFKEQNEIGMAGEHWVCDAFSWKKLSGRKSDILTQRNTYLELKTETYKFDADIIRNYSIIPNTFLLKFFEKHLRLFKEKATKNLFIETTSDTDEKTRGGPFRTLEHNIPEYAHIFPRYLVLFLFDTKLLVDQLNLNEEYLIKHKGVNNGTYHTSGYIVEIDTIDWEQTAAKDRYGHVWKHFKFKGFNRLLKLRYYRKYPKEAVASSVVFEDATISSLTTLKNKGTEDTEAGYLW